MVRPSGTETPQHTVASIAHVNFDELLLGQAVELNSVLTDVHKTPMRVMLQSNITPMQMDWNVHNASMLRELPGLVQIVTLKYKGVCH